MTERLSDCKKILDLCKSFSTGVRTVIIIRHSERISFHDVPMDKWDGTGITHNGFAVARDLGRSLVDNGEVLQLNVYSWGYMRCSQTAGAIADGARERGLPVCELGNLGIEGPVSNHVAYDKLVGAGKWQELMDTWQRDGDTNGSLTPIAKYSPSVFREILDPRVSPPKAVSLIVTHDVHIVPLARHAMGTVVEVPDYLDGLVIGENGNGMKIGYHESVCSRDSASLTR